MEKTPGEPWDETCRLARRIIRLASRVVVVGVVLCGAISLPQKVLLLWETDRAMAEETAALQQQLEAVRKERRELEEERRFLQTPAGILLEARRLGYGFPGEIRLMPVPEEDRKEKE